MNNSTLAACADCIACSDGPTQTDFILSLIPSSHYITNKFHILSGEEVSDDDYGAINEAIDQLGSLDPVSPEPTPAKVKRSGRASTDAAKKVTSVKKASRKSTASAAPDTPTPTSRKRKAAALPETDRPQRPKRAAAAKEEPAASTNGVSKPFKSLTAQNNSGRSTRSSSMISGGWLTGTVVKGPGTGRGRGRPRKAEQAAPKARPASPLWMQRIVTRQAQAKITAPKPTTNGKGRGRGRKPAAAVNGDDDDGVSEETYEVEAVVDSGVDEVTLEHIYLVKWVGYSSSQNTWEPRANLMLNCKELLTVFDEAAAKEEAPKKVPGKRGRPPKKGRAVTKKTGAKTGAKRGRPKKAVPEEESKADKDVEDDDEGYDE